MVKLDRLGLIELLPKKRVRPLTARRIQWWLIRLAQKFDEVAELDVNVKPTEKQGYGLMIALRPWAYRNVILNDSVAA